MRSRAVRTASSQVVGVLDGARHLVQQRQPFHALGVPQLQPFVRPRQQLVTLPVRDEIGRLAREEVEPLQFGLPEPMDRSVVRRQHPDESARTVEQRCGLQRANASVQHDRQRSAAEVGAPRDVLDDDPIAGSHGHTAGGVGMAVHPGEVFEERRVEPDL